MIQPISPLSLGMRTTSFCALLTSLILIRWVMHIFISALASHSSSFMPLDLDHRTLCYWQPPQPPAPPLLPLGSAARCSLDLEESLLVSAKLLFQTLPLGSRLPNCSPHEWAGAPFLEWNRFGEKLSDEMKSRTLFALQIFEFRNVKILLLFPWSLNFSGKLPSDI